MARDTADTKRALLDAARAEFAAYGIAGARVDRIAERAGVNKERIYGHFGSKDKLFDSVMSDVVDEVAEVMPLPGEDVGAYVAQKYEYHREHPELLRLLLWEALHYGDDRRGDEHREAHYRKKLAALAEGLGAESSPELGRVLLTVMGLASWPSVVPQLAPLVLGDAADDTDAMRDHLVAFARAAVDRPPS